MAAIFAGPEFTIYKTGSNHKLFRQNLSDETAGVTDIQTDFDTLWSNFKTTVGDNACSVFIKNGVYDYDTGLTPTGSGMQIFGENKDLTILRPQGNIHGFSTNNRDRITLKNFRILSEHGSSYNKNLLDILANGVSVARFDIEDLVLDHIVTSVRQQYGNSIGFRCGGASPAISWFRGFRIWTNGALNAIHVDTSTLGYTGSAPWINEIKFIQMDSLHPFNYCKTLQGPGEYTWAWYFQQCGWQSTQQNATTGHMFDLDDNATAHHWQWQANQCILWDPFDTTKKFLKANLDCRFNITDCFPTDNRYMGGSGWDATNQKWNSGVLVHRTSYDNKIQNKTVFSASGTATDFQVSVPKFHGNVPYCRVNYSVEGPDCRSIPHARLIDNPASVFTTFTVRFARPPRKGTNNVIIHWNVEEVGY